MTHVVFQIYFDNKQYLKLQKSDISTKSNRSEKWKSIMKPIKSNMFLDLFPFYILINRSFEIVSLGDSMKESIHNAIGENVKDVFNLIRPYIAFTWVK